MKMLIDIDGLVIAHHIDAEDITDDCEYDLIDDGDVYEYRLIDRWGCELYCSCDFADIFKKKKKAGNNARIYALC